MTSSSATTSKTGWSTTAKTGAVETGATGYGWVSSDPCQANAVPAKERNHSSCCG